MVALFWIIVGSCASFILDNCWPYFGLIALCYLMSFDVKLLAKQFFLTEKV